jgi:hypothetical protein
MLGPVGSGADPSIGLATPLGIDPEEVEIPARGIVEGQDGFLSGAPGPGRGSCGRRRNGLDCGLGGPGRGFPCPRLRIDHDPLKGVRTGLDAVGEARVPGQPSRMNRVAEDGILGALGQAEGPIKVALGPLCGGTTGHEEQCSRQHMTDPGSWRVHGVRYAVVSKPCLPTFNPSPPPATGMRSRGSVGLPG